MIKKGTNSFTKIFSLFFIFLITAVLITGSCTKLNEFTIGDNFVDSRTHLTIVDTFKIDVSTVLVDSLYSSGTSVAYAGRYHDDEFGTIACTSYFNFAYQGFSNIDDDAVYDSAALILTYSGYSLGDTTSLMSLGVHRLTESIEPFRDGYLYNNSTFDYSPELLGSVEFYPAPNSSDSTVSIPLNTLGEELFNLIASNDEEVSSSEWFLSYLKGFALTSGENSNAIIGFNADDTHLSLKIYYHENTALPIERKDLPSISISMGQSNYQFNNLSHNFSNSALEKLVAGNNEISSAESGNRAYLQGVTGLLPKLRFPTIQNILMEERWKILKAELIIVPVRNSYDKNSLPDKLYLYSTDRINRFSLRSVLKDSNGDPILSSLEVDEIFNEDTKYTIDITKYINDELADNYFDYNHGLFLGLSQNDIISSLDRLTLENKSPRVKLRVYLLSY